MSSINKVLIILDEGQDYKCTYALLRRDMIVGKCFDELCRNRDLYNGLSIHDYTDAAWNKTFVSKQLRNELKRVIEGDIVERKTFEYLYEPEDGTHLIIELKASIQKIWIG